jgi:hypothetical protein
MDWSPNDVTDVIKAISSLLTGFLAAWVFYGLTAHPKRSPFERVVQSLIFTTIIQGLTAVEGWLHAAAATYVSLFTWTKDVAFVASLLNALLLGLLFAYCANHDLCHSLLRYLCITKRTSYPSEWFSAFNQKKRYVILHLEGGRRLYGWPVEWPDQPESGHFVMAEAEWLLDNNEQLPLPSVDTLLIPASTVEMVEIIKLPNEIGSATGQANAVSALPVANQSPEETKNGKQSTAAATQAGGTKECIGQATAPRIEAAHATSPTAQKVKRNHQSKKGRR